MRTLESPPKIFICGASGLLGADLCSYFKNAGIEYKGTYNTTYSRDLIKIDFNKTDDIEKAFSDFGATVCINCIVERRVNICEDNWNLTKNINIDIPNRIAKICQRLNIFFIHISTDYVFDGKLPPYLPDSFPNPLQNYGISKLISEKRVTTNCKKSTIIRVSVLYTDTGKNFSDNAVTLIGKKVINRIETCGEDNYSIRRPNYIPDFCHFIGDIVNNPQYGIFHYYNPNVVTTKYQTAKIISEFLNKPIINHIFPIDSVENSIDEIERPLDTQLIDTKYDINKYSFTPFHECISRCFKPLYHPQLFMDKPPDQKLFFLLDLDGTLVDTDKLHYEAYKNTLFKFFNFTLNFDTFEKAINTTGIDLFLKEKFTIDENGMQKIKSDKKQFMLDSNSPIIFMKNSEKLINYINKYNIGHAVVTNTNKDIVESFKRRMPELNLLSNWITREDYNEPKPNKECYELALTKFGKGEEYIVGIENSMLGYKALCNVTKCIYIVTDKNNPYYSKFKNEDVYLINDYEQLFYI